MAETNDDPCCECSRNAKCANKRCQCKKAGRECTNCASFHTICINTGRPNPTFSNIPPTANDRPTVSNNNNDNNNDSSSKKKKKRKQKKVKQPKWRNSKAKELLKEDFMSGVIPLENDGTMDYKTIFEQRPEYAEYGYTNFPARVRAMREQLIAAFGRAQDDVEALETFIKNNPKSTHTHKGYPEWEGSEAQRLLNIDIDNNDHKPKGGPKVLHASKAQYRLFPLKVFREHIYQELDTRKFYHTLKVKGKSQGKKNIKNLKL